jgi:hypothetical protein
VKAPACAQGKKTRHKAGFWKFWERMPERRDPFAAGAGGSNAKLHRMVMFLQFTRLQNITYCFPEIMDFHHRRMIAHPDGYTYALGGNRANYGKV